MDWQSLSISLNDSVEGVSPSTTRHPLWIKKVKTALDSGNPSSYDGL